MKNPILAGIIAGIVMGPLAIIIGNITVNQLGLIEPPGGKEIWGPSMFMLLGLAHISLGLIWGSIFGVIYASIFNIIPSKGVIKGLYFGLMIWLIKDVCAGSYTALILVQFQTAINLIYYGFSMWVIYGLVLGYLYKPTKRLK